MKREFLKSIGIENLSDEQIDKIMSEHGKSIEAEKSKGIKTVDDLKTKTAELDTLNGKIKELETSSVDSEKFKTELEKLKADNEEKEKQSKEKAELNTLHTELDTFAPEEKEYLNEWSKNGIRSEAVKLYQQDPTKGLKHHYESLIKDDKGNFKEGIFSTGVKNGEIPALGNTNTGELADDKLRSVMGLPVNDNKGNTKNA